MTYSQEEICEDINNTSHITSLAAAYTIYEASKSGTKTKIISKENFAKMYLANARDFKDILDVLCAQ